MLYENMRGFATMDADLSGYYLQSESLETCKEYCRPGCVVVEMLPKKEGLRLDIRWYKPFKDQRVYFSRRLGRFDFFHLHVRWAALYGHKKGKIVYRNEGNV